MNRSPAAVFFFPLPSRGTPLLSVAACFFPFSRFRDTSSDNPLPGIDKKAIARVTLGRVGRRLSSIDSVDCSTKRKAWNGRYETGWKASPESSTTASLRQQREIEREEGEESLCTIRGIIRTLVFPSCLAFALSCVVRTHGRCVAALVTGVSRKVVDFSQAEPCFRNELAIHR